MARLIAWAAMLGVLCACGTAGPLQLAGLPSDQDARRQSLDKLGHRLFEALRAQAPEQVLLPMEQVDALLNVQMRSRVEQERLFRRGHLAPTSLSIAWAGASYAGFCAQGAREEGEGGPLGLTAPAWTLERMLVVAQVGTKRSASWVEGSFVFTDRGWKVVSLSRIEAPRTEHSDLELAPCDVERGIR